MIIIIGIAFMAISWAVSSKLKSKFKKYAQIQLTANLTGAEAAKLMLRENNILDVEVLPTQGELSDHYNPGNKTINLSEAVYYGRNAAAVAVATHECGHAVQHATAYSFLKLRSALVPIQNASAKILNIVVMVAIFGGAAFMGLPYEGIIYAIIACYGVLTLFSVITLPVEFDASKRALAWINDRNVVTSQEYDMAKDALKWAAMTYVVAAIGSLVTLMYYVSMLLGGRD